MSNAMIRPVIYRPILHTLPDQIKGVMSLSQVSIFSDPSLLPSGFKTSDFG